MRRVQGSMAAARALLAVAAPVLCAPGLGAQQLAADPASAARFGTVPEFQLLDSRGESVSREDLAGTPWIAACFFTACQGPCPRLNADIRRFLVEPLTEADESIRVVSISVDPEYDTPERLAAYAEGFGADPERWLFLTGEESEVHALVTGGFSLPIAKPEPGDVDPDLDPMVERLQITHSTRLIVVDPAGEIAGYYECGGEVGLADGEIEGNFARALDRARALAGPVGGPRLARLRLWLPRLNATLNGIAAVFLVLGLAAIRAGQRERHAWMMRAAFLFSAAFLASYVYYHTLVLPLSGGPTRFHGKGWQRGAYLAMLASHVILAVINLPMVLRTFWLAHKADWERHKRLAKKTFPIWLYVSVTGVLVYVVLYHGNPGPAG